MQFLQLPSKIQTSPRLINLILISSSCCIISLFLSLFLVCTSKLVIVSPLSQDVYTPTSIEHIVFGIASSKNSWPKRKDYVRLWWKPYQMRGCVFLESTPPNTSSYNDTTSLPPICISEDTSRFRYTYRGGLRSAIRVARVVSETVALNHSNVRWFVFGDDDTVFFPENLVKTLSKYDNGLWYYIGTHSEIYEQNRLFSFGMAFGGAGFAISYPLAKVLAKVFDSCIERYPHLYGSDARVYSCLAELGVGLTHEPGFHQGNVLSGVYAFNTKALHPDPCRRPTIFFLDSVSSGRDGIKSIYQRNVSENCSADMGSPRKIEEIKVFSTKLDLDIKQLQAPRRHCCDVLPSSVGKVMEIAIRECKEEELIYMHP
ncbi:hypothetical protein L1049_023472 [Liquidambar formosana]|uniref:Uncharacterized protein n=1 Tax=Liquidambar formosana TaxID=63359 RepID=A0AAP0RTE9_LIQFO